MSWVAVGVGAVGLIGGLASAKGQESAMKEQTQLEIQAQKQLAALQRQWQLQDRQYRQNAVGNWAGYLDPKLVGGNSVAPATTGAGDAKSPVAPAKDQASLPTTDANGMPITDPNNPLFAANPTAAPGSSTIPINTPAQFQGMSPQSASMWSFMAANPNYNFFNPNPDYAKYQQQALSASS